MKTGILKAQHSDWWRAGRVEGFLAATALWAVSNACIGATPAAYAADVMPQDISGLALGIYRCAGDLGEACQPTMFVGRNQKRNILFVKAWFMLPPCFCFII